MVETLNVSAMLRNRRMARSIADAEMSGFQAKLEYKCAWYGAEFVKAEGPGCGRAGPTPPGAPPSSCGSPPDRVRYAAAKSQLTVRADSGFYNHAIVVLCRRMGVRISITVRQHQSLRNMIEAIP